MNRIYLNLLPEDEKSSLSLDRDWKKRLIKVLRLKVGDVLQVFAPGTRREYRIHQVLADGVELELVRMLPPPPEPRIRIILAQAVPKGDRFEWLIQKATELGVAEIYPLITSRSVARPDSTASRLQRWNEIAAQAAGQSENTYPAVIHPPVSLDSFLKSAPTGLRLLLHERQGSVSLHHALSKYDNNSIVCIVGPEGGWDTNEVEEMIRHDFHIIHLGQRVLRAETAGLALAAIIQYQLGDFAD